MGKGGGGWGRVREKKKQHYFATTYTHYVQLPSVIIITIPATCSVTIKSTGLRNDPPWRWSCSSFHCSRPCTVSCPSPRTQKWASAIEAYGWCHGASQCSHVSSPWGERFLEWPCKVLLLRALVWSLSVPPACPWCYCALCILWHRYPEREREGGGEMGEGGRGEREREREREREITSCEQIKWRT